MARRKEKTPEYFTVEVERLDQEGRGVGHHDGKVVFIEGALPGELVTYERIRNKTSFEIGRVAQVHRESVQRVEPRCPKFGHGLGSCGGCAMQHLEPRAQVAYKERTLIDTLWHIGRVRPEQIITPIYGPFWNYRHRARLTVRDVAKKGGVLVGFHEKSSSYVAEMTGCHILTKNVSDMIMPMRELVSKLSIRQCMPQIEVAVGGNGRTALVFRTLEEPTDGDMALLNAFGAEHKADIWLQPKGPDSAHPVDPANINALGLQLPEFGVRINFKPTDFTQVNHELNETMVSRAVRLLGVEPEHKVADFFCGLGNFTLPLRRARRPRPSGRRRQRPRREDRFRGPQPLHVVRPGLGGPLEEDGRHRPRSHRPAARRRPGALPRARRHRQASRPYRLRLLQPRDARTRLRHPSS